MNGGSGGDGPTGITNGGWSTKPRYLPMKDLLARSEAIILDIEPYSPVSFTLFPSAAVSHFERPIQLDPNDTISSIDPYTSGPGGTVYGSGQDGCHFQKTRSGLHRVPRQF